MSGQSCQLASEKTGEIGIWDAMVKAEEKDGIRSAVRIELKSVVGAATKVANKPGEMHAFASLQTAKRRLARPCVVGKVEKSTHSRAEGEASLFFSTRLRSEALTGQLSLLKV